MFLAGCLLPTAVLVGHLVARSLPQYVASIEAQLVTELGIGITIGDVLHPKPGLIQLRNVRCNDPESTNLIAVITSAHIRHQGNRREIVLGGVELNCQNAVEVYRAMHDRLMRTAGCDAVPTRLSAKIVELVDGQQETKLHAVDVEYKPGADESTITVKFRLPEFEMSDPVVLRVTRKHRVTPRVTRVELRTGNNYLPCSAFAPYVMAAESLGDIANSAVGSSSPRTPGNRGNVKRIST